ncbi:hypothetical protein [Legionella sainthelensi]|uniref:hypothetical protein n=1 Tax=Legionella sainthelensi TaxID=28087 RepID=UPI001356EB01|nr:hypothetical protein [Legionella sainthelensi]
MKELWLMYVRDILPIYACLSESDINEIEPIYQQKYLDLVPILERMKTMFYKFFSGYYNILPKEFETKYQIDLIHSMLRFHKIYMELKLNFSDFETECKKQEKHEENIFVALIKYTNHLLVNNLKNHSSEKNYSNKNKIFPLENIKLESNEKKFSNLTSSFPELSEEPRNHKYN